MYKKRNNFFVILIMTCGYMWGCGTNPTIHEFPSTANSADEVQRFSSDMQVALADQIDVLAPTAYKEASDAHKTAVQYQEKGAKPEKILHQIAFGRSQLTEAYKSANISHDNMEEVLIARQAAIGAGANKLFVEDFAKADDSLRFVTSRIEDDDLSTITSNRDQLQQQYLDVELKAIKKTNLEPAREKIALAKTEGAQTYAKQSLAIAEQEVNNTEAFITANRNNTYAIESRSTNALEKANHLVKINRASKVGQRQTSEQNALLMENEQIKTQDKRKELAEEKNTSKYLALDAENLKIDRAYNQSFETARAQFTKNEAEVYRQGNKLIIRLRSLNFPVNQSYLRKPDYTILGKVANVIKGFNNSNVVIEGHTDSDGTKESNNDLSSKRSQTVSNYFISSGAINREKIKTVGLGSEYPLASNKTSKGKAQNRRVDVIIDL